MNQTCQQTTGICVYGCLKGYTGERCNESKSIRVLFSIDFFVFIPICTYMSTGLTNICIKYSFHFHAPLCKQGIHFVLHLSVGLYTRLCPFNIFIPLLLKLFNLDTMDVPKEQMTPIGIQVSFSKVKVKFWSLKKCCSIRIIDRHIKCLFHKIFWQIITLLSSWCLLQFNSIFMFLKYSQEIYNELFSEYFCQFSLEKNILKLIMYVQVPDIIAFYFSFV